MRIPIIHLLTVSVCILSAARLSAHSVEYVSLVSKILGSKREWDSKSQIRVQNDSFKKVVGTDLGAVTLYDGKLWFCIGDTQIDKLDFDHIGGRFMVAYTSDTKLDDGIDLEGYLRCNDSPDVAIDPKPRYPIPNALFTIRWAGSEYMFGQYMEVDEVSGHDHHVYYSALVRYDRTKKVFVPYKPDVYRWTTPGAPKKHFHFAMASFWVDYRAGWLYAVGSPSGRFGGVKLARIPLKSFMRLDDKRGWEYFLGEGKWSAPTDDPTVLDSAAWLIPPKDKDWNPDKDYDTLKWSEQAELITVAEFSVIYNPYLKSFMLITGRPTPANSGGGVWCHTAPNITGPWSKETLLMANHQRGGFDWSYYGTYTTDAMLKDNGKKIFLLATTWETYGVYLYEISLAANSKLARSTPKNHAENQQAVLRKE